VLLVFLLQLLFLTYFNRKLFDVKIPDKVLDNVTTVAQ